MKELEDLIIKNFGETRWMLLGAVAKSDMLLMAKEIYNKAINDSSQKAEAKMGTYGPEIDFGPITQLLIP